MARTSKITVTSRDALGTNNTETYYLTEKVTFEKIEDSTTGIAQLISDFARNTTNLTTNSYKDCVLTQSESIEEVITDWG